MLAEAVDVRRVWTRRLEAQVLRLEDERVRESYLMWPDIVTAEKRCSSLFWGIDDQSAKGIRYIDGGRSQSDQRLDQNKGDPDRYSGIQG